MYYWLLNCLIDRCFVSSLLNPKDLEHIVGVTVVEQANLM